MAEHLVCVIRRMTLNSENQMINHDQVARRPRAAANFLDDQLAGGRVCFSLPALMGVTGLSSTAAHYQLLRLGRRVVRISPRFFLIVTPEYLAAGAPPPYQWLDDYFRWLERPYYLGLLSAAAHHGASPQALQVTQVMTDAPRHPIEVGRLRVCFFVKRKLSRTATQQVPGAFAPLRASTPASTVFDLVRYAPRTGGLGRVVESFKSLLPLITPAELRAVLKAEHETASAQRLGYVLDQVGRADLARVVESWLDGKLRLTPLVPAAGRALQGRLIARWHIFDNSGEFHA